MLLAVLFLLVVLEDEDVVDVRHNSFAVPGQGRHLHSQLVVVAVVVAAVAVVVAAVVIVVAAVVIVAVDIHEQRNGLRHDCKFLGLHWHSGPFVQVYFEESLD
jgi:hypothetical protein